MLCALLYIFVFCPETQKPLVFSDEKTHRLNGSEIAATNYVLRYVKSVNLLNFTQYYNKK